MNLNLYTHSQVVTDEQAGCGRRLSLPIGDLYLKNIVYKYRKEYYRALLPLVEGKMAVLRL